jgi:hypothetical protein
VLHAFFKQLTAGGNIYAGRTLHLRAQSLALSNGANVTAWTNEGLAGGTFTALTGEEPTYNTNQVNSLPAVNFGSIEERLSTTRTVSQVFGSAQDWAFVVAGRGIGNQTTGNPPIIGSAGAALRIFVNNGTSAIIADVNGTQVGLGSYTSNVAFVAGVSNSATQTCHHIFNSTAIANARLPTLSGAASASLIMGLEFDFFGICEMMAFNKFKTAAELAAIAAAMRTKYAIS